MSENPSSKYQSEPDYEFGRYIHQIITNLQLIQFGFISSLDESAYGNGDPELLLEDGSINPDLIISSFEKQFSTWMSSFYNVFVYLIINLISFIISMVDTNFHFLPLTLLFIFPFYLWFVFLYSIPEIKVQDKIIFSRKNLDLRLQIKLGRFMFRFFIEQLVKNSRPGLIIIAIFTGFLFIVMINTFL